MFLCSFQTSQIFHWQGDSNTHALSGIWSSLPFGVGVLVMWWFMEVFKECCTPHQREPHVTNVLGQHSHSPLTNHKLVKLKKQLKNS